MPGTSSQRRALLAGSTGSGTAITKARRNRIAGSSLMPADHQLGGQRRQIVVIDEVGDQRCPIRASMVLAVGLAAIGCRCWV